jgi:Uma2 family endonuclease
VRRGEGSRSMTSFAGRDSVLAIVSTVAKLASYDDLLDLPENQVGEIVNGTLHVHPRPTIPHARAATALGEELGPRFGRSRGGPNGWVFLDEPELHLGRQILVPDLAAWRRERMPELPDAPYLSVAPDWVCEVLAPSTEGLDRSEKLPLYARHGVAHAWLLSPLARSLEVFRLDGATFRLIAAHRDTEQVNAEPFEELALDLGLLWQR